MKKVSRRLAVDCGLWLMLAAIPHQIHSDPNDPYSYNLFELSRVEVSLVEKVPRIIKETPATIHIITAADIKTNGYFTLEEALADLPGFSFRNPQGYNSYVFQRGIPNQNNLTLLLVDGIQINELNSGGFYAGGQFNLANVERIEVVYGPLSVIYGTNAISGVINIITKTNPERSAEILAGSFNTYYANANYAYTSIDNNLLLRISTMFKTSHKAELRGNACDSNWTDDMELFEDDYALDFKIRAHSILAGLNFQNKQSSVSTQYPSVGTPYQDHGTLWNIYFLNAYIKHETELSDHLTLSTSFYGRNATVSDNTIFKITDTEQTGYYRPNYLLGAESVILYDQWKNVQFSGGISYEFDHLAKNFSITYSESSETKPPPPPTPLMETNSLISVFIKSQITARQYFILDAGLRFDRSSVYENVLTPCAALIFSKNPLNLKLIYAQAFRAPKPWDYYNGSGNPSLVPEEMESIELSANYFLSRYAQIGLSGYKNLLSSAITKETLGDGDDYRWINQGKIETKGFEFTTHYFYRRIKFLGNYTYISSANEKRERVPEIPKQTINAGITYYLVNNLQFNIRANFTGSKPNSSAPIPIKFRTIASAQVYSATISVINIYHFNAQLAVKNIFNTEYYHSSNLTATRFRQAQRTFLFKITYDL